VRVREVFDAGADGVTIPHPQRRRGEAGDRLLPDRGERLVAVESQRGPDRDVDVGDPPRRRPGRSPTWGYSILACGIGGLAQALGGDREAPAVRRSVGGSAARETADMLTFNAQDAGKREAAIPRAVDTGSADEAIKAAAAAGR
jgi:hypothetical protein